MSRHDAEAASLKQDGLVVGWPENKPKALNLRKMASAVVGPLVRLV